MVEKQWKQAQIRNRLATCLALVYVCLPVEVEKGPNHLDFMYIPSLWPRNLSVSENSRKNFPCQDPPLGIANILGLCMLIRIKHSLGALNVQKKCRE